MALIALSGCSPDKHDADIRLQGFESLRFSSQPITERPLLPLTSVPVDELELATRKFKQHLHQLADYANQIRTAGAEPVIPPIFSNQFETTFLERNKLQSAFLGERIRIARWRLDDDTPTFYENIAIKRLFKTLVEPWVDADSFRIDFLVYTVNDRPNYYDAEILVDISGTVKGTSSSNGIGRSATGLWQIIWQKSDSPNDFPLIKKINMLGHEETVSYLENGKLFHDCTSSVLRKNQALEQKLSYGIDEWSTKIPGIDAIGNNGLAVGDVNNDGLDDIYICQPHGMENILLIQNPDGTADDAAALAGVNIRDQSTAALIIDIDNDRLQDLVVATESHLVLYSNAGNGVFQLEHKLKIGHGTESLSATDFDSDGDLDLFVTKYRPVSRFDDIFPQPNATMIAKNGGRNVMLRNDEAWNFKDATSEVGLSFNNQQYTRAAIWSDFDSDGDTDLYLANDFYQDSLLENKSGWFGEFKKHVMAMGISNSSSVSCGDFNHDGKSDFFVATNTGFTAARVAGDYINSGGKRLKDAKGFGAQNRIYYQEKTNGLTEFPFRPPIFSSESTFSSVVADFNNDGWEDIATTNGWLSRTKQEKAESIFYSNLFDPEQDLAISSKNAFAVNHEVSDLCRAGDSFNGYQRNRCFLSLGPLRFSNFSNSSGLDFLDDARAIASTDWDGDGDIDLIVNNRTAPRLRILKNVYSSKNQFLKLRLTGSQSNRDAIGARVEVFLRGANYPLVKSLQAGSGRMSQSSKELHFGLGKSTAIESVVVNWPNSAPQTFKKIAPNKTYQLVEGKSEAAEISNDRYRIALDSTPLTKSEGLPKVERIKFFPSTRLPILQYRTNKTSKSQKWFQVDNIEQRPLLCIICPNQIDNSQMLRDWNIRERNFSKMNADLLVVFTGNNSDRDSQVEDAATQIDASDFIFRWGVLSAGSNSKLAQAFGQWFFSQNIPEEPFGFLLDGDGNVHFAYDNDHLNWDSVESDLQNLADKNYVLNRIPERADENWIVDKRTPRFDRLAKRFEEIGYVRDANVFKQLLSQQHSNDYLNRALDLASDGDLVAALPTAERSLELNPESVDAMIGLAQISRAYALTADQQARTRMLRSAGSLLDDAIDLEPNNEDAILARAEIFRLQKDIENALNLLNKYLSINPESWQVHAIIGRLLFHKREYFEATKHLITAIENRPTLPFVAADLGYLYLLNKQFVDSKEYLELAIRLQPSDANLKRHLAEAEFWNGNFRRAGDLFEETIASLPTLSHPKQMLAWLKGASPFEDFRDGETGLEIIKPFVELRGNQSPSSLETMAVCLADMGEFDQALSVQKQALDSVENGNSIEIYSDRQIKAMRDRLEMYKRSRTYRIKDVAEVPMSLLGDQ